MTLGWLICRFKPHSFRRPRKNEAVPVGMYPLRRDGVCQEAQTTERRVICQI